MSPLVPIPNQNAAILEPLESPLHDIPDDPDTHDTGNPWNPALREQILRDDLDVDDSMFNDPVVDNPLYRPASAADTPRMDMKEYDSAMTDMLRSIGVDKLSAEKCVGTIIQET